MQPYQNFQPIMSTQYPPYGQTQIQQPYLDRLSQLQMMQQNMQPQQFTGLNGRVVDSVDNIMASDVPMDGNFAIFPKRDMSEISVKYWTGEGKIATIVFKPISEPSAGISSMAAEKLGFDEFLAVLETLNSKVDTLSGRLDEVLRTRGSQRGKKEVIIDE